MSKTIRVGCIVLSAIFALLAARVVPFAQGPADNPYRPVKGLADGGGPSTPGGEWVRLPGGKELGPPASVHVDADGESIWALVRCDETNPVPVATSSTRSPGRASTAATIARRQRGSWPKLRAAPTRS